MQEGGREEGRQRSVPCVEFPVSPRPASSRPPSAMGAKLVLDLILRWFFHSGPTPRLEALLDAEGGLHEAYIDSVNFRTSMRCRARDASRLFAAMRFDDWLSFRIKLRDCRILWTESLAHEAMEELRRLNNIYHQSLRMGSRWLGEIYENVDDALTDSEEDEDEDGLV